MEKPNRMAKTKLLMILCHLLTCAASAASWAEAEPPVGRKLGSHRPSAGAAESVGVGWPIRDGEAPSTEDQIHSVEMVRRGHHHSTLDKSVAGGGVIIGGLATTFLVAVFCYIRATRRHKAAGKEDGSNSPRV